METAEMEDVLGLHDLWIKGQPGGEKAYFSGAFLRDQDFSGRNLNSVDFLYANLPGSNFDGCDLSKTNFRQADMSGSTLKYADLSDARCAGINLSCADLRHAVLNQSTLSYSNLEEANLSCAMFHWADMRHADLSRANLSNAHFRDVIFVDANLTDVNFGDLQIPVIENIDSAILDAIDEHPCLFDMSTWHGETSCGTTHCRAGWAVHLADEEGYQLESRMGTCSAGALIYAVSRPGKTIPDFYASERAAMQDMIKSANSCF